MYVLSGFLKLRFIINIDGFFFLFLGFQWNEWFILCNFYDKKTLKTYDNIIP